MNDPLAGAIEFLILGVRSQYKHTPSAKTEGQALADAIRSGALVGFLRDVPAEALGFEPHSWDFGVTEEGGADDVLVYRRRGPGDANASHGQAERGGDTA